MKCNIKIELTVMNLLLSRSLETAKTKIFNDILIEKEKSNEIVSDSNESSTSDWFHFAAGVGDCLGHARFICATLSLRKSFL